MKKRIVPFVLLVLVMLACNITANQGSNGGTAPVGPDTISTTVAQTFEAMTRAAPPPPLETPTLPAPPAVVPTTTLSPTPAITTTPPAGSIKGSVTYPYGPIPRLMIVAFDKDKSYLMWWSWFNGEGMGSYIMDSYIPPSHYQVVAYDKLGHAGGCTTIIEVKSNQVAICDITNWGGSYPPNPNPIP